MGGPNRPAQTNAGGPRATTGGAAPVSAQGAQTRVASSAFPRGQDEPQAKRGRQEGARMGELAEYGLEETKETATTKVPVLR